MDLLIQAAQSFRDKNLYWVTYSPRPDDINDKVRAFLATSRHARLLPGQDADHFFLDLCRAMKVGPPSALVRPLESMERLVRDISHHPAKDPDIQAEIEAARRRLRRLRELDERTLDADPIAAIVTRIRERRLSGDHAEAYRLALEAMQ